MWWWSRQIASFPAAFCQVESKEDQLLRYDDKLVPRFHTIVFFELHEWIAGIFCEAEISGLPG